MEGFWKFLSKLTETGGKTVASLGVGGIVVILIVFWILF